MYSLNFLMNSNNDFSRNLILTSKRNNSTLSDNSQETVGDGSTVSGPNSDKSKIDELVSEIKILKEAYAQLQLKHEKSMTDSSKTESSGTLDSDTTKPVTLSVPNSPQGEIPFKRINFDYSFDVIKSRHAVFSRMHDLLYRFFKVENTFSVLFKLFDFGSYKTHVGKLISSYNIV